MLNSALLNILLTSLHNNFRSAPENSFVFSAIYFILTFCMGLCFVNVSSIDSLSYFQKRKRKGKNSYHEKKKITLLYIIKKGQIDIHNKQLVLEIFKTGKFIKYLQKF